MGDIPIDSLMCQETFCLIITSVIIQWCHLDIAHIGRFVSRSRHLKHWTFSSHFLLLCFNILNTNIIWAISFVISWCVNRHCDYYTTSNISVCHLEIGHFGRFVNMQKYLKHCILYQSFLTIIFFSHVKLWQDVYLHTNCLATLANMAPHAHRLSAYASQRLVSLFDMLSRKYVYVIYW